jgi:hypothetical protein
MIAEEVDPGRPADDAGQAKPQANAAPQMQLLAIRKIDALMDRAATHCNRRMDEQHIAFARPPQRRMSARKVSE